MRADAGGSEGWVEIQPADQLRLRYVLDVQNDHARLSVRNISKIFQHVRGTVQGSCVRGFPLALSGHPPAAHLHVLLPVNDLVDGASETLYAAGREVNVRPPKVAQPVASGSAGFELVQSLRVDRVADVPDDEAFFKGLALVPAPDCRLALQVCHHFSVFHFHLESP